MAKSREIARDSEQDVLQRVRSGVAEGILFFSPRALKVLKHLAEYAERETVRADCAKTLLQTAGFVAPRPRDDKSGLDKPLNDMSTSELRALVDRLEGEVASRARPINATVVSIEAETLDESILD